MMCERNSVAIFENVDKKDMGKAKMCFEQVIQNFIKDNPDFKDSGVCVILLSKLDKDKKGFFVKPMITSYGSMFDLLRMHCDIIELVKSSIIDIIKELKDKE